MTDGTTDDSGFVATEWAIGVAILVVPVLLLAALMPSWAARHEAAAAAAREGARVAVLAGDSPAAADRGATAARTTLLDRGISDAAVLVALPPRRTDGTLPREGVVTVTVTITGETVILPGLGAVSAPTVRGAHSRALDPHRSRG